MAFINWSDKYELNIKAIDSQHQGLVEVINELHEAMKAGKAKEIIETTLDKLVKYTITHFSSEEKLMEQHKYPSSQVHKLEHQKFTGRIKEFQSNYKNGGNLISIDILNFLRDWLINHINRTDKLYQPYVNN